MNLVSTTSQPMHMLPQGLPQRKSLEDTRSGAAAQASASSSTHCRTSPSSRRSSTTPGNLAPSNTSRCAAVRGVAVRQLGVPLIHSQEYAVPPPALPVAGDTLPTRVGKALYWMSDKRASCRIPSTSTNRATRHDGGQHLEHWSVRAARAAKPMSPRPEPMDHVIQVCVPHGQQCLHACTEGDADVDTLHHV